MPSFDGWVRKMEKKNGSNTVAVPQLDGSVGIFPSEEFWLALFCAQATAAAGVFPEGPVPDAVRNATPETIERIGALDRGKGPVLAEGSRNTATRMASPALRVVFQWSSMPAWERVQATTWTDCPSRKPPPR